jgi:hypothetical protein
LQPPDSASITADFGLFPSIIVSRLSQENRHNFNNLKGIRVRNASAGYRIFDIHSEGLDPPDFRQLAPLQQAE